MYAWCQKRASNFTRWTRRSHPLNSGSPGTKMEVELLILTCLASHYALLFLLSVFNWTNQDVLDWLEHSVELPQYTNTFKHHQITGRQLPYIAINSGQILQNTLLITDSQHKQKIVLRAMDIILFGPPVQHGYWKDAILVVSVILCVCGILYALRQRMLSKSRIDTFIADLRLKEEEVKRLKSKFEELELPITDVTDGKEEEEEVEDSPIQMTAAATASTGSPGSDEDYMLSFCKCVCQVLDRVLNECKVEIRDH